MGDEVLPSKRGGSSLALDLCENGRHTQANSILSIQRFIMHIPDGFLSTPTCLATAALATVGIGYSLARLKAHAGDRLTPLLGVLSAGVFAGQMVNFPVMPGVSGHLLGGALAAIVLGPWGGALALTIVLVVQLLLYYDGGATVLGANVVNMALVGGWSAYVIYAVLRRAWPGPRGTVAASVLAAWTSVLLASLACAVELAASGTHPFGAVLGWLLFIHIVIGLGEAAITGLVVATIVQVRPDLLYQPDEPEGLLVRWSQVVGGGLIVAALVAIFLAPFASSWPDGLEYVAEQLGFAAAAQATFPALLPDYTLAALPDVWYSTSIAGLIGVGAVFVLAFAIARSVRIDSASPRAMV